MNKEKLIEWINGVNSWLIEVGEDYPGYVMGEIIENEDGYPLEGEEGNPILEFNDGCIIRHINLLDEENVNELLKFPLGSGKICNSFFLKSLTGYYFNVYCNIEIVNRV